MNRALRFLLPLAAIPACSIYGEHLFVDGGAGVGGSSSGGKSSGGGDSGGSDSGGGSSTGGTPSGGTMGDGGQESGGTGATGTGGSTGGAVGGSGGASGGAGTGGGGSPPSGGTDPGGGSGGMAGAPGGGTGGMVDPGCTEPPCLVDDLNHENNTGFYHKPFRGSWSRYIQDAPGAWVEAQTRDMIQERSDEAGNFALHVAATGLDDWGLGVFATLSNNGPMDIRDYSALSFYVRSDGTEISLAVALADKHSHRDACVPIDEDECDQHVRYATFVAMTDTWTKVTLDLVDFIDLGNQGRVSELDESMVYAIHFQMDPMDDFDGVDFWIDDIYLE